MSKGYTQDCPVSEIGHTGWTTQLETGVEILDEQHRNFFDFSNNAITTALDQEHNEQDLAEKLGFLIRYAMEHFSVEQAIMQQEGYPHYLEHVREHMDFLKRIKALRDGPRDYCQGSKLAREIRFNTLDWFVNHIQSSDMKLVEFLQREPARISNF